MQIIPVLDLAGGVAVHARAGDRSRYAPVTSALAPDRAGRRGGACCAPSATCSGRTNAMSPTSTRSRAARVQRELIRRAGRVPDRLRRRAAGGCRHQPARRRARGARPAAPARWSSGWRRCDAFADLAAIVDVVGRRARGLQSRSPAGQSRASSRHARCQRRAVPTPSAWPRRPCDRGARRSCVLDLGRVGTGLRGGPRAAGDAAAPFPRDPAPGGWRGARPGGTSSGCGMPAATARWSRAPFTPGRIAAADLAALACRRAGPISRRPAPRGRSPTGRSSPPPPAPAGSGGCSPRAASSSPHLRAEILRQHLGRAVRDRQQRAVAPGKDVGRLAEVVHREPVALLPEGELGVLGGQQHLVVDLVDQAAGRSA